MLFALLSVLPLCASAGGITLNGTRVIYPQAAKQVSLSVRNTSAESTFLVQSWAEDKDGQKTKDFVSTPPLFTSAPGNENMLRLMFSGGELPRDRESLYYFNVKAIPSVDKAAIEGKNALILAAVTRIKLFVRPAGLTPAPEAAPAQLRFAQNGQQLSIHNPTPYYLTLTNIKAGAQNVADTMVSPMSHASVALPAGSGSDISFSTINDFGAVTPPQKGRAQ